MKLRSIYWLAGLLEGEGCFTVGNSASLVLQMTDVDVMQRAARLFHSKVGGPLKIEKPHYKPMYYTQIHGSRAAAWMMTLWPLMGERRQARILECLRYWRSHKADNKSKEFCKRGHPLSGDNLRFDKKSQQRVCRVCQQRHQKNFRSRQRSQTDVLFHRN